MPPTAAPSPELQNDSPGQEGPPGGWPEANKQGEHRVVERPTHKGEHTHQGPHGGTQKGNTTRLGWGAPEFCFWVVGSSSDASFPLHFPFQKLLGPFYLLIGELLGPYKQVGSREARAGAEEGDLHALVRIPETEQQTPGDSSRQPADKHFKTQNIL